MVVEQGKRKKKPGWEIHGKMADAGDVGFLPGVGGHALACLLQQRRVRRRRGTTMSTERETIGHEHLTVVLARRARTVSGTRITTHSWKENEKERERESKPMIRSDIPRTIAIQRRHSLDMKTSSQTRLYTHTRHCQCAETPVGGSQPLTGSPVSRLYAALPTLFSPPSGAADLHRINDTSIPSLSQ